MQAGVAQVPGALPSTKDLEQLQRDRPACSTPATSCWPRSRALRAAAQRAGLLRGQPRLRGGTAGQIVVVPKQAARRPATRALGERPPDLVGRFAQGQQHAGRRRRSGRQPRRTSPTRPARSIPLVVAALALAVALVLMIALRSVVAAARRGRVRRPDHPGRHLRRDDAAVRGSDPLLGGPGYLDRCRSSAIFAAIFGISIAYEVLLLARTREHFAESGDARAALRLRRSAAPRRSPPAPPR